MKSFSAFVSFVSLISSYGCAVNANIDEEEVFAQTRQNWIIDLCALAVTTNIGYVLEDSYDNFCVFSSPNKTTNNAIKTKTLNVQVSHGALTEKLYYTSNCSSGGDWTYYGSLNPLYSIPDVRICPNTCKRFISAIPSGYPSPTFKPQLTSGCTTAAYVPPPSDCSSVSATICDGSNDYGKSTTAYGTSAFKNLFDNDVNTVWNSGGYAGEISIHFARPHHISSMKIYAGASPSANETYILTSTDTGTPFEIARATRLVSTGPGLYGGTIDPISVNSTIPVQNVTLKIQGGPSWVQMSELSFDVSSCD